MATSETQQRLAEITDPGLFERLATAVIREADQRHRLLVHSGVNRDGKTVKGSLDGITFTFGKNSPHMVAVHHTICRRKDLERKWLYDPKSGASKGRRCSKTPTGDLVKSAQIFKTQKQRMPALLGTLILTTNREPSDKLVLKVTAVANAAGLEVLIWARSAIAHFLEHDPQGQWIRKKYLNIEQDRLSHDLLKALSQRSLEANVFQDDIQFWVDREIDLELEKTTSRDVLFLVGDSGFGKSVACHKRLMKHVSDGGIGLVVPHRIVANSVLIEQAIEKHLRDLHPPLSCGVGGEALTIASESWPLLIVIEDINRSAAPIELIERLVSWSARRVANKQSLNWQILCPVWPRIMAGIGERTRRRITESVIYGSSFTSREAITAVRRRHEKAGIEVSTVEAETVASTLGGDPLLIALHDPAATPSSNDVIGKFVEGSLCRLSAYRIEYTPGEYLVGLRQFAAKTLKRRCHDPSTKDIENWYEDEPSGARRIRHIVQFGELVRLSGDSSTERFQFRHDRVRQWIQADAVADMIRRDTLPCSILDDPYFAEIIGLTLVYGDVPDDWIEKIRVFNPLVLFCALRQFGEPTNELHCAVIKRAESWLDDAETHEPQNLHLRWHACRILAECDASYVVRLAKMFRGEKENIWVLQAMFRNGDCLAGIKLCARYEPGMNVAGFPELIEHVQCHHADSIVRTLANALEDPQLTGAGRRGALRLAGHFGIAKLANAVRSSWIDDSNRNERLDDYLWACAQCSSGDAAYLLSEVCDAWAALPRAEKQGDSSPRDELAAYHVRWAFNKRLPEAAVIYFIERAKSDELRWPIIYMLQSVDNPYAVDFVAREFALTDKRLKKTGGFFLLAHTAGEEWKRRQEETGFPMSRASRQKLKMLWSDKENVKYLRAQAFRLWASTTGKDDICILQDASTDKNLHDSVLFQRLRRGDSKAIPELVEKLKCENNGYWWQTGRYIWSDELTECLDFCLCRRRDSISKERESSDSYNLDWVLYERIMELPTRAAEELLIAHWDHVRSSPYYIQSALYVATPKLREMVAQEVDLSSQPEIVFEHIIMRYGVKIDGRTGIKKVEQMETLVPYLGYLGEYDIQELWRECNRNGWVAFRRRYLDELANVTDNRSYWDDSRAIAELDKALKEEREFWPRRWVERFLETGVSIDSVINVLRNWLSVHEGIPALKIASVIITNCGSRAHLGVLEEHKERSAQAKAVIQNTVYSVKRRSMN